MKYPTGYEPQSVTAARSVLGNEEEPPYYVYREELIDPDAYGWRRSALRDNKRDPNIIAPDLRRKREEMVQESLERGLNSTLFLNAIDDALRECFVLLATLGKTDKIQNRNLYTRFASVILDEMGFLVGDWDSIVNPDSPAPVP
jgi:hypothetical protein